MIKTQKRMPSKKAIPRLDRTHAIAIIEATSFPDDFFHPSAMSHPKVIFLAR